MAINSYLLYIFRSTPYGSLRAREGIDALLAASVFDLPIKVLFAGDGIFQLTKNQSPSATRSIEKTLKALAIYDINDIYIHRTAMESRNLNTASLSIDGHLLGDNAVARLLHDATHILSF